MSRSRNNVPVEEQSCGGDDLISPAYFAQIVDEEVACRLIGGPVGIWHQYPVPAKGKPNKRVLLLTDSPHVSGRSKARVMRLPTPRSVDSYFHRFRSNLRFARCPQVSTGDHGRIWGRHHLCDPSVLAKIVEIDRLLPHLDGAGRGRENTRDPDRAGARAMIGIFCSWRYQNDRSTKTPLSSKTVLRLVRNFSRPPEI